MIRVARQYGRGYDMKLTCNALVIVIANGDSLDYNEVKQMIGRGSRGQGECDGLILMLTEEECSEDVRWAEMKAKGNQVLLAECCSNLVPLVNALPYLETKFVQSLTSTFEDNRWKTNSAEF